MFVCELWSQPFGEEWAALLPGGLVAGRGEGRREAERRAAGGAEVEAFSLPGRGSGGL